MLPPFIIEQIRQREERERARHQEQPRLELPIPPKAMPPAKAPRRVEDEDDPERGVVILDIV